MRMRSIVSRLFIVMIAAVGGALAAQGTASADCGMHAFETSVVPSLQKTQAAPLIPANLFRNATAPSQTNKLALPSPPVFLACSDEPQQKNEAATDLMVLWSSALKARGEIAALSLILAGQTNANPACYDYARLETRYEVAVAYTARANRMNAATLVQKYGGAAYWPNIQNMWAEALKTEHLTPPPSPGIMNEDFTKWTEGLAAAANAVKEHLPDGVQCYDDPVTNFYTPKTQSFVPDDSTSRD